LKAVRPLAPVAPGGLHLLCLGAHPDDIEIGAGGTVLRLAASGALRAVTWIVFSGTPERRAEGARAADAFLDGVADRTITFHAFRDGFFPAAFSELKEAFEALKGAVQPDLVIAPRADDAHQDHRLVAELTWNTFRDHLVLGYEIPKYDGDLHPPNAYVALDEALLARKIDLILSSFGSQRDHSWFDAETFRGMARIRGIEAGGPVRYAEAYHASKLLLAFPAMVEPPASTAEAGRTPEQGGQPST
jgi:LmbE family N-acetylglucosaminyl deacetylase